MDRRGFLLLGAAGVCTGLASGFPPVDPSREILGRTEQRSGLFSLASLGDRRPPYFDSDTLSVSGTGENRSVEFESDGGFTMVRGTHEGEGRFTVTKSSPGRSRTLLETTGPGEVLTGLSLPETTHTFEVNASGEWTLTVAQPQSPQRVVRRTPARAIGTGDLIAGPLNTVTDTRIKASHKGDGPFRVKLLLEGSAGLFQPDTVLDTTGTVQRTTTTRTAGVVWIVVTASGEWTLAFDKASL